MDKKTSNIPAAPGHCAFCFLDSDDEERFDKKHEKDGITVHYFCMLFASGLRQAGKRDTDGINGFLIPDIKKEVKRASRLKCVFCTETGATIGCSIKTCKTMFHFPCGQENGVINQYFGHYRSLCDEHKPRQEEPGPGESPTSQCPICQDDVITKPTDYVIRAPCCTRAWYHKICVQKMAHEHGMHHFRCPLCTDTKIFTKEVQKYGVYIPDRDAAWETQPGAFQEQLERHSRCDMFTCVCPKGREYNKKGTRMEIILCDSCGSQGTHLKCSKLKSADDEWLCTDCMVASPKALKNWKSLGPLPEGKAEREAFAEKLARKRSLPEADEARAAKRRRMDGTEHLYSLGELRLLELVCSARAQPCAVILPRLDPGITPESSINVHDVPGYTHGKKKKNSRKTLDFTGLVPHRPRRESRYLQSKRWVELTPELVGTSKELKGLTSSPLLRGSPQPGPSSLPQPGTSSLYGPVLASDTEGEDISPVTVSDTEGSAPSSSQEFPTAEDTQPRWVKNLLDTDFIRGKNLGKKMAKQFHSGDVPVSQPKYANSIYKYEPIPPNEKVKEGDCVVMRPYRPKGGARAYSVPPGERSSSSRCPSSDTGTDGGERTDANRTKVRKSRKERSLMSPRSATRSVPAKTSGQRASEGLEEATRKLFTHAQQERKERSDVIDLGSDTNVSKSSPLKSDVKQLAPIFTASPKDKNVPKVKKMADENLPVTTTTSTNKPRKPWKRKLDPTGLRKIDSFFKSPVKDSPVTPVKNKPVPAKDKHVSAGKDTRPAPAPVVLPREAGGKVLSREAGGKVLSREAGGKVLPREAGGKVLSREAGGKKRGRPPGSKKTARPLGNDGGTPSPQPGPSNASPYNRIQLLSDTDDDMISSNDAQDSNSHHRGATPGEERDATSGKKREARGYRGSSDGSMLPQYGPLSVRGDAGITSRQTSPGPVTVEGVPSHSTGSPRPVALVINSARKEAVDAAVEVAPVVLSMDEDGGDDDVTSGNQDSDNITMENSQEDDVTTDIDSQNNDVIPIDNSQDNDAIVKENSQNNDVIPADNTGDNDVSLVNNDVVTVGSITPEKVSEARQKLQVLSNKVNKAVVPPASSTTASVPRVSVEKSSDEYIQLDDLPDDVITVDEDSDSDIEVTFQHIPQRKKIICRKCNEVHYLRMDHPIHGDHVHDAVSTTSSQPSPSSSTDTPVIQSTTSTAPPSQESGSLLPTQAPGTPLPAQAPGTSLPFYEPGTSLPSVTAPSQAAESSRPRLSLPSVIAPSQVSGSRTTLPHIITPISALASSRPDTYRTSVPHSATISGPPHLHASGLPGAPVPKVSPTYSVTPRVSPLVPDLPAATIAQGPVSSHHLPAATTAQGPVSSQGSLPPRPKLVSIPSKPTARVQATVSSPAASQEPNQLGHSVGQSAQRQSAASQEHMGSQPGHSVGQTPHRQSAASQEPHQPGLSVGQVAQRQPLTQVNVTQTLHPAFPVHQMACQNLSSLSQTLQNMARMCETPRVRNLQPQESFQPQQQQQKFFPAQQQQQQKFVPTQQHQQKFVSTQQQQKLIPAQQEEKLFSIQHQPQEQKFVPTQQQQQNIFPPQPQQQKKVFPAQQQQQQVQNVFPAQQQQQIHNAFPRQQPMFSYSQHQMQQNVQQPPQNSFLPPPQHQNMILQQQHNNSTHQLYQRFSQQGNHGNQQMFYPPNQGQGNPTPHGQQWGQNPWLPPGSATPLPVQYGHAHQQFPLPSNQ